jgi:hypothetical protein
MDVKTTFLSGELEEEIYMDQPDRFIANGQEGKVCKLLKSLYGLKQTPKQWHKKFDKTLTSTGFVVNEADSCVYYLSWNCPNYKSTTIKTITEVIKFSHLSPYNSGSPMKLRGISNQPT